MALSYTQPATGTQGRYGRRVGIGPRWATGRTTTAPFNTPSPTPPAQFDRTTPNVPEPRQQSPYKKPRTVPSGTIKKSQPEVRRGRSQYRPPGEDGGVEPIQDVPRAVNRYATDIQGPQPDYMDLSNVPRRGKENDFMLGGSRSQISDAYLRALGRRPGEDELQSQLGAIGWQPGDRYVGEKGLRAILGSLAGSEEGRRYASGIKPFEDSPDYVPPGQVPEGEETREERRRRRRGRRGQPISPEDQQAQAFAEQLFPPESTHYLL